MGIFLLDVSVISTAIYLSEGLVLDFYIVYLLTIFMAAIGENLKGSLFTAAIAGGIYTWLGFERGIMFEETGFFIRIPFLFVVAFFTGYLSQQVRNQRNEWERIEQSRQDLQTRLEKATHSEELAYEKLLSLYEYNENILQSIDQGVMVVDLFGGVTVFNRGAENVTGFKAQEVCKSSLASWKEIGNLHQILMKSDSETNIEGEEIEITRADRKVIPVEVTTSHLKDPHGVRTGTIVLFKDLSQVKDLKDRLHRSERLAVLGEMAAYVAHEIRNPLNSINGFSQLIHQKVENGNQIHDYAEVILEEANRVDQTMEEILDVLRFKKPIFQTIDINMIIKEAIPSFDSKAFERGVSILESFDNEIPNIQADGHQLRQVFINLLSNALDATDDGGKVQLQTGRDTNTIKIVIENSGEGILEENIVQIFNPFFTTKAKGTGLGLSIARKIIEDHGGAIDVESYPGKGTKFTIDFPLTQSFHENANLHALAT
jgi:PAS domain S-box-containing protein